MVGITGMLASQYQETQVLGKPVTQRSLEQLRFQALMDRKLLPLLVSGNEANGALTGLGGQDLIGNRTVTSVVYTNEF